jgi:hypothetical protein
MAVEGSDGAGAVYVDAVAEEVGPDDRADALAARARDQGIDTWDERQVTGASQFRVYRARASRTYVLDDHDGRVEVAGPLSPGGGSGGPAAGRTSP